MAVNLTREEALDYICRSKLIDMSNTDFEEVFLDMGLDYCSGIVSEDSKRQAVLENLRYCFRGAPNQFIANYIYDTFGTDVAITGKPEDLFPCPCCGAKSLDELYNPACGTGYDICEYCGWEDDGTDDPNKQSSVNKGTMSDYRVKLPKNESDNPRWIFAGLGRSD